MKLARCALRNFFRDCLRIPGWTVFEEVRIAPPETLPLVLAREQVATLLGAVREPRYRTLLTLIYHAGLRVGEAVRVRGEEFVRRVLQHVLPKGFQCVRHYGWRGTAAKARRERIAALLD